MATDDTANITIQGIGPHNEDLWITARLNAHANTMPVSSIVSSVLEDHFELSDTWSTGNIRWAKVRTLWASKKRFWANFQYEDFVVAVRLREQLQVYYSHDEVYVRVKDDSRYALILRIRSAMQSQCQTLRVHAASVLPN